MKVNPVYFVLKRSSVMMAYNNPSFVIFALVILETFLVLKANNYWNVI